VQALRHHRMMIALLGVSLKSVLGPWGASLRPRMLRRIGWHNFRHSHSPLLHAPGVDLRVQQELLRHADTRTTANIYRHAIPSALREANRKVIRLVTPAQVA
jgi:integrase